MCRYILGLLLVSLCGASYTHAYPHNPYNYEVSTTAQVPSEDGQSYTQVAESLPTFVCGIANGAACRYLLDAPVYRCISRMWSTAKARCNEMQVEKSDPLVELVFCVILNATLGAISGYIKSAIGRKVAMPLWRHIIPYFSSSSFSQGYTVGHVLTSMYYLYLQECCDVQRHSDDEYDLNYVFELADGLAG